MFSKIMVPVDLAHVDRLEKTLRVAEQMAKANDADIVFVGVAPSQPGSVARSPEEFDRKLTVFAGQQGQRLGVATSAATFVSVDIAAELDDTLFEAIESTGADLCVMQSHIPGLAEYIWASHGGKIASHAEISVFLVR